MSLVLNKVRKSGGKGEEERQRRRGKLYNNGSRKMGTRSSLKFDCLMVQCAMIVVVRMAMMVHVPILESCRKNILLSTSENTGGALNSHDSLLQY